MNISKISDKQLHKIHQAALDDAFEKGKELHFLASGLRLRNRVIGVIKNRKTIMKVCMKELVKRNSPDRNPGE